MKNIGMAALALATVTSVANAQDQVECMPPLPLVGMTLDTNGVVFHVQRGEEVIPMTLGMAHKPEGVAEV